MSSCKVAEANQEQSLIQSLAGFANDLSLDKVPERVRQEAKLCILDTLGCILAGADMPEAQSFLKAERQLSGQNSLDLLIPSSPVAKARIFGYWGDVFELNDLVGGHGSIGNVTAAILGARVKNATGADLLRAVITGLEITCRLQRCISAQKKPFEELANVSICMVSAFGAAGALSQLYRLPEQKTANALAVSGAIANWGPAEVIFGDGGTIKPIQFGGCPAESALRAVEYAENDITGPLRLLESKLGLLTTFTKGFDSGIIRDRDTWYLLKPQRKLHACCGFTHSSIDAVVAMRNQGVDFTKAEHLELALPEFVISGVYKPKPPTTSNEARFHISYCVALAANGADAILPDHSVNFETFINQPEIKQMIDKISIRPLEESEILPVKVFNDVYNQSVITVRDINGEVTKGSCTAPRGSAANPLSDDQVLEKFRLLTQNRFGLSLIDECIEKVMAIEMKKECGWIYDLLDKALASVSKQFITKFDFNSFGK